MAKRKIASIQSSSTSKRLIPVSALNEQQKNVLRTFSCPENVITFIEGVPGTGKTYLSVSWGLDMLKKEKFSRLIFTRPYVEAGEHLGFLPGNFDSKIQPFMIPVFDILTEHLTHDEIKKMIDDRQIIVLPLAYMRGITFKDAFVLLDEAQNTTIKQMHMFLTRIGNGCKVVLTGDNAQSDLNGQNGLKDAMHRLDGVPGIEIVKLDSLAVVRHPIIAEIDRRYQNKGNRTD